MRNMRHPAGVEWQVGLLAATPLLQGLPRRRD
jgi:hypothetical protein